MEPTYIEKIVITITGFRPMRSAKIPQIIEVKVLPNIYAAPRKVKKIVVIKFSNINILEIKVLIG